MIVLHHGGSSGLDLHAHVLPDLNTSDDWKQIEYHGVSVEIPLQWIPLSTADCASPSEHWGLPGTDPCDGDPGVTFLDAARARPSGQPAIEPLPAPDGSPAWSGWISGSDTYDVHAGDDEKLDVRRILGSVRTAATPSP